MRREDKGPTANSSLSEIRVNQDHPSEFGRARLDKTTPRKYLTENLRIGGTVERRRPVSAIRHRGLCIACRTLTVQRHCRICWPPIRLTNPLNLNMVN